MSDHEHIIPLFPLGIVALPGLPIPLHIFEERYKQMIQDCLNRDGPFGIVLFQGERMHDVGCTVRVLQVIKRYNDGRMDILTQGEQRFIIRNLIEEKSYLQASITFFGDRPEETDADLRETAQKGLTLLRELSRLLTGQEDEFLHIDDMEQISFTLAGSEGFSPEEKQTFLEMTSTRRRLEKSTRAMASLIERVRLTEQINRLIRGNGYLRNTLGGGNVQDRLKAL